MLHREPAKVNPLPHAHGPGVTLGVALCFGVILAFLPACERDTFSTAERELSARLESTFGISLPCSLSWCDSYMDGGTVGGLLIDAKGDSLKWAWGR